MSLAATLRPHRHGVLFAWCCLPIFAAIFHFGPGQRLLARDAAAGLLVLADASPATPAAAALRKQAAQLLDPATQPREAALARLRQAQAMWKDSSAGDTSAALDAVLREALKQAGEPGADQVFWNDVAAEARLHLIRSQHACAWMMRLQGAPRHTWLRELDVARQSARLLLETRGEDADLQRNLEACVWLERVDLKKLRGLPLPENQDPGQGQGQGEGEGEGQPGDQPGEGQGPPKDGRGTGRRPEGPGS